MSVFLILGTHTNRLLHLVVQTVLMPYWLAAANLDFSTSAQSCKPDVASFLS